MFDELKKKLKNAVSSFIKTEKAEIEAKPQVVAEKTPEIAPEVKVAPVKVEKPVKIEEIKVAAPETEKVVEKLVEKAQPSPATQAKTAEPAEKRKDSLINLSLKTKIKSVFVGTVKLSDSDIDKFLDAMKVSMPAVRRLLRDNRVFLGRSPETV